jgi:NADH dehydrogenase FAD-containing subunit
LHNKPFIPVVKTAKTDTMFEQLRHRLLGLGDDNRVLSTLIILILSSFSVLSPVDSFTSISSSHKSSWFHDVSQSQSQLQPPTQNWNHNNMFHPLHMIASEQSEKILRQEIADRQMNVDEEGKYGVPDGAYLEKLDALLVDEENAVSGISTQETSVSSSTTGMKSLSAEVSSVENDNSMNDESENELLKQMKRITKPRWYPLFIAEKVVEFAELSLKDVTKSWSGDATDSSSSTTTVNGGSYDANRMNGMKERVVVLGTGWGGASFVKNIDPNLYDVTIISPRNHFVFTPMLAGASVGTVEYRSICEPIREINRYANYIEATATDINVDTKSITCESVVCDGNSCEIDEFTIPYDRLVVTVGAQTNTFGIKGVKEYCNFLRQVEDARRIRTAIVNCFERANIPTLTNEEREHALTFAIIGAGPTGIEFAAELRDFVEQDVPKYYPKLLKFVRIKVIEASSTILAPFDKSLQVEAINQMNRQVQINGVSMQLIELLLETSVKEVGEKTILLNDGGSIPYGLSVWAAGNGPVQLTLNLINALGEEQKQEQDVARGRLAIDPWMRVIGSRGTVLSFGDCSCITCGQLPATAQVASQQGEYLASLFNKKYELSPSLENNNLIFPPPKRDPQRTVTSLSDTIASIAVNNDVYAKPFQFLNLGILAYTGSGSALAQVTPAPNAPAVKSSGKIGNAVWRSVYLTKQFSMRNRLLVLNDWTKRQFFGRDITRL